LGGFGQVPGTVCGESGDTALYEGCIHLADGKALSVDPGGNLLSSTHKPLDATRGIAFVVQGGREVIEGGSQRTPPQPNDHTCSRTGTFKLGVLLFLKGCLEKEKDGMSTSCRVG
jgi:hypothetical protein